MCASRSFCSAISVRWLQSFSCPSAADLPRSMTQRRRPKTDDQQLAGGRRGCHRARAMARACSRSSKRCTHTHITRVANPASSIWRRPRFMLPPGRVVHSSASSHHRSSPASSSSHSWLQPAALHNHILISCPPHVLHQDSPPPIRSNLDPVLAQAVSKGPIRHSSERCDKSKSCCMAAITARTAVLACCVAATRGINSY